MWTKLGRVLKASFNNDWLHGWAGASCAIPTENESVFRVYITGKDNQNRSRIGTALLNVDSLEVQGLLDEPVIPLGRKGTLDENGTSYPHVVKVNDEYLMYYLGWIRGIHVPWYNGVFLAKSYDGVHFSKVSEAPIFDRNQLDPLGVGSMFVIPGEDHYRMWYARFDCWGESDQDAKHYYNIRLALSKNGMSWKPTESIAIHNESGLKDYAIAKPSVLYHNGKYYMWYSYRGTHYTTGLAFSKEGHLWQRRDDLAGITVSESGWDAEMICYPFVFKRGEDLFMLYNGNNYGEGGLGLAKSSTAILEKLEQSL